MQAIEHGLWAHFEKESKRITHLHSIKPRDQILITDILNYITYREFSALTNHILIVVLVESTFVFIMEIIVHRWGKQWKRSIGRVSKKIARFMWILRNRIFPE